MSDVLERFLRYVQYDTQSDERSTTYPSTDKQLVLLRDLVPDALSRRLSGQPLEFEKDEMLRVIGIGSQILRELGVGEDAPVGGRQACRRRTADRAGAGRARTARIGRRGLRHAPARPRTRRGHQRRRVVGARRADRDERQDQGQRQAGDGRYAWRAPMARGAGIRQHNAIRRKATLRLRKVWVSWHARSRA